MAAPDRCPPGHVDYGSETLAANAVTLHLLLYPHCPGMHSFPCGDHYHVGHTKHAHGVTCRARHATWHRGVAREGGTLQ